MMSLLPLLFLALVTCIAARARPSSIPRRDIRDGLLVGAVCTGVWAWAGAEGLSRFHEFARVPVLVWWLTPVLGLSLWVWKHRPPAGSLRIIRPTSRLDLLLVGLAAGVLILTGAMAFLTPPTTYDALSYHLPREMYWIHNRSIAQYPSFDLRQIEMPPLAEYIGAQLMLLSGTDHQANLVQWFSYLLAALGASAIARDMGAGYRGQAFAALLVVLNPAAATQAENAKNDLVEALWLMALFWAAVRMWVSRRCTVEYSLFAGAALGLLLLTKGTGFAFAPPVCVMIGFAALRADWKRAIPLGATMIAVAIAINTPHWVRNKEVLGSPFCLPPEKGGFALQNELFTPAAVASNLVRNLTLHTSVPSPSINNWERARVAWLHRRLGISEADARTTSPRTTPFIIQSDWNSDGNNAAPVHVLLGAAMVLSFRPGRLGRRVAWPAFLIPFGQMLLFAVLLKWQFGAVRLQIPLVSAAAAVMAVWMPRARIVVLATTVAAFGVAMAAVLYNGAKPLVGFRSVLACTREQIMFSPLWETLEPTREIIRQVAKLKPRVVAMEFGFNGCEYLMMRSLQDGIAPPPRLVPMRTVLEMAPQPSEVPDCEIVERRDYPISIPHAATGTVFTWVSGAERFRVYVPVAAVEQARRVLPLPTPFGWDGW